jgi:polyisoprenyl-teichoic acid--peptidoglycan teichoic acid transferase
VFPEPTPAIGRSTRQSRWGRALRVLAALVLIALAATMAQAWIFIHTISPRTEPGDIVNLLHEPDPAPGSLAWEVNNDSRVNVLLLAYGGAGNDDPNFTDTMLLLSMRPSSARATVVSLPRYLLVEIPAPVHGVVVGRLYSAYAAAVKPDNPALRPAWRSPTGAGDLASATVSGVLGVNVTYWMAIDSAAFEALVDALGGIHVNIPERLDDANYPSGTGDRVIHVRIDAGSQTLDGARALEYARSRLSTSDVDRSRRQELVLSGLFESLHTAHVAPEALFGLSAIENGLRTNLRPVEMIELAHLMARLDQRQILRVTLEDSPLFIHQSVAGGADIIEPKDGSYAALQRYIDLVLP